MKILKSMIIGLISLVIISCTTVKKPIAVELKLPPPISKQNTLNQEDLRCVTPATLDKIIVLDKRRKTLRNIILTTHKTDPQSANQ